MNPEKLQLIPKSMITDPEILGRVCWNLANRLSDNRWILDGARATKLERAFTDREGIETTLGDTELRPIYNETKVGFFATKYEAEGYKGHLMDISSYKLTMSVIQSISHTDMPPNVLDEIFELKETFEADEDEGDEKSEYDDDGSVLELVTRDNLDEFHITREQEICYDIEDDGSIESYEMNYTYAIDDESVHEISYNSGEGARITTPIKLAETGEEVDRRPATLLYLSEAQLTSEVDDMEKSWFRFVQENTLREIAEFHAQDQSLHRRQALALIGLVSSGIFGLKRLAQN